jgi:hypothetical protein
MAVELKRTADAAIIALAMEVVEDDWPEHDLFEWLDCKDRMKRSLWAASHARWWNVWDRGLFCGYIAAVDDGKGRWYVHFGAVAGIVPTVFAKAFRKFLKLAQAEGVRIVAAYISMNRADVHRLARILKFRRFEATLWVLTVDQSLKPCQKRHQRSRQRTKA